VRIIEEAHSHFISCLRWAPGVLNKPISGHVNGSLDGDDVDLKPSAIRCVVASGSVDLEVKIWMP
jgi:platelet-activating factor acetylhydrolase IB subunit alpha